MIDGDGAALMRQIVATPEDDVVRLLFADWLDENATLSRCDMCEGVGTVEVERHFQYFEQACGNCGGTGRVDDGRKRWAELIRVQIALANLVPGFLPWLDYECKCTQMEFTHLPMTTCDTCIRHRQYKADGAKLIAREEELLNQPWPAEMRFPNGHIGRETLPRRGMTWRRSITMWEWLNYGKLIAKWQPIEEVHISDKRPVRVRAVGDESEFYSVSWIEFANVSLLTPNLLPAEILPSGRMRFPTSHEAMQWLSKRCLEWARSDDDE
jgi:uncharacterized protein (TIGR02996 family)